MDVIWPRHLDSDTAIVWSSYHKDIGNLLSKSQSAVRISFQSTPSPSQSTSNANTHNTKDFMETFRQQSALTTGTAKFAVWFWAVAAAAIAWTGIFSCLHLLFHFCVLILVTVDNWNQCWSRCHRQRVSAQTNTTLVRDFTNLIWAFFSETWWTEGGILERRLRRESSLSTKPRSIHYHRWSGMSL